MHTIHGLCDSSKQWTRCSYDELHVHTATWMLHIKRKTKDAGLIEYQVDKSKTHIRGTWVAQWVKRSTSAQVMISPLVSLSPAWGSVLTAWSLEPTSDSVSPVSLPAPPPLMLSCSLALSKINIKK